MLNQILIKMKLIRIIAICLLISVVQQANAQKESNMRTINIAGLVVDSENLSPILGANIYDNESEKLLTNTNENGYFKFELDVNKEGEIDFSLKINEEEYETLIQKEHWGDLPGNHKTVYYFGLKHKESKPFSELSSSGNGTSYEMVLAGFENVKEKVNFKRKMQQAREGNQDVIIEVEGSHYIVSDSGWIKLKSKEELISINGNKVVTGEKLNSLIKRNSITGMSPSDSENMDYIIYINE